MVRYRFASPDGMNVVFREPRRGDARQLMDFINCLAEEPMSGILVNRKTTIRAERKWLKERLAAIRGRRLAMLVLEHEGTICGSCDVERKAYKQAHRGVFGIALSKGMRGKGAGEALARRTIDLAIQRIDGLEAVELATFDYNKRAQRLYKRLGFVEVGRIPEAVKEGGKYFDELLMILRLEDRKR